MTNKDRVYEVLKQNPERALQEGKGITGHNDWIYEALEGSGIPRTTIKTYIRFFRKEHKDITKNVTKSNSKNGFSKKKNKNSKRNVTKSVTDPGLISIIHKLENEINKLNKSVKELQKDNKDITQPVLQKIKQMEIKPHTVRISKPLLDRCKQEAKDKGLKLYEILNLALYEYLENK